MHDKVQVTSQHGRSFNMKLTNEEKQTITNIITRLIEDENIEKTNLLAFQEALESAKKLVIDYVVEGQS